MRKRQAKLIYNPETGTAQAFPFVDMIEVGRARSGEDSRPNRVAFGDPKISSRHCVVTQTDRGHFFIRDLSRNGTRVDGKRLVPNLEVALEPRQVIQVGDFALELWADQADPETSIHKDESTILASGLEFVTVLVGDIRGYTTLNQQVDTERVSRAVRAVFAELEAVVGRHGGTLKEYQGDALFAFWEESPGDPAAHTLQACKAALALEALSRRLARRQDIWNFDGFPLCMRWALATGAVMISSYGKDRPTGLSMVGDTVNLAFRLEKLANPDGRPIVVCRNTQNQASSGFEFTDLGEVSVKGRTGQERVFALQGPRPGA